MYVGRVAGHGQHLVVAEDVVARAVVGEVGVFDRADADSLGDLPAFFFGEERLGAGVIVLRDDRVSSFDGFVEQSGQADGRAGAGLERPAVFAEHGAERDVLQVDVLIAPQPGDGEELLEVERLAMIDDIENRVWPPLASCGIESWPDR